MADLPDPKYISPARIALRPGQVVDVTIDADGYKPQRRTVSAAPRIEPVSVTLEAELVPLVVRVVPRDAEIDLTGCGENEFPAF